MKPIKQQIELTKEGLDELQTELTELVEHKLPATIVRVTKAREHGDLSENAEYHSARDDQQLLQSRIDELQDIVSKAKVIKQTRSNSKVGIGSVVIVSKVGTKKEITLKIVGEFEANPKEGKVSNASPMGNSLMGKKKGDNIVVKAPAGNIEYEIKKIN
ncbi:transcription elongation factor GreA [Patescibacteria group bacterium]|nr:transcription elongation factor GreA [Patescibacteria group bacterium]